MRALCFLLMTVFIWLSCMTSAQAQPPQKFTFDIAAQPVQSALIQLALQRDLDIVFYTDLGQDVQSSELKGEFSLTEAFAIMLKGTNLRASISNSRLIQIERYMSEPPVKVEEPSEEEATEPIEVAEPVYDDVVVVVAQMISPYNLGTTVSSTKTQRGFLETPQAVSAIPEELSKDIGARDLADVTMLASSATYLERSAGVTDELRLRGFAYPSLKINGIGAHAYIAPVDVAFIDRIEIAKGPSSVLFGRMEPGGIVNMMLKQPEDQDEKLLLRYATDDYARFEFDVSSTIGDDSSVRAIGFSQRYGDAADLDQDDADGLMLGFQHYLENSSRLTGHYRYESQNVLQQFGSPVEGFDNTIEFFRNENGGFETVIPKQSDLRSGLDVTRESAYLALNDWLIGNWSADLHIQHDQYEAASALNYPIIRNFVVDFNGQQITQQQLTQALIQNREFVRLLLAGIETISVDPDNIIYREALFDYNTKFFSTEFTLYQSQFVGEYEFEQLYGLNINRSQPETLIWQTHDTRSSFLPLGTSQVFFNTGDVGSKVLDKNAGVFGQWVLNHDDLTLFFGARVDSLAFEVSNELSSNEQSFTETSIRLGAVYKLDPETSLYVNYSEAFSPQFELLELAAPDDDSATDTVITTIAFPEPARSHQYEAGIKSSALKGKLQTSCAIFAITKTAINSLTEEQQSSGAECDISGSLGEDWHLTLGVNYLDSEITAASQPELLFNRPRMAPETSGHVWLSKDVFLSDKWSSRWGVGLSFIDERYLDIDNEELLPSYYVLDFGVTLEYGEHWTLSLLLTNALDETFTEGVFDALPFWTNPGRERTFETRIEYQF